MSERSRLFTYLQKEHNINLNQQQRNAVTETAGRLLLLAVPGAGKTTVLVTRVAHTILELKADPSEILTITFNREAAQDMTDRFERLFSKLCPETPRFSTIHSFCYRVLRYYTQLRQSQLPTLLEDSSSGKESGQKYKIISAIYIYCVSKFFWNTFEISVCD